MTFSDKFRQILEFGFSCLPTIILRTFVNITLHDYASAFFKKVGLLSLNLKYLFQISNVHLVEAQKFNDFDRDVIRNA
jgi:hypothetical protein